MDRKFVQQRIARIRNAHKISARRLSLELGQSTEYINQIENGNSMPSLDGLFNFCDYFGISLGEFFEENYNFPVEYGQIISELNKMDAQEIGTVYELLKVINKNKK